MAESNIDIISYIESLIRSDELQIASKLLDDLPFDSQKLDYSTYLKCLCSLKQINPNYSCVLDLLEKLNNNSNTINYMKYYCRFKLGQYEDIVKFHLSFLSTKLENNMKLLIAYSYEQLNLTKNAKKVYYEILENSPRNSLFYNIALNNILIIGLQDSRDKEVLDLVDSCFDNKCESIEILNNYALCQIENGNIEKGLEIFDKIFTVNEINNSNTKMKVINNYLYNLICYGDKNKAEAFLKDYYIIDSTGISLIMFANLKISSHKYKEALDIFENYPSRELGNLPNDVKQLVKSNIEKLTKNHRKHRENTFNNNSTPHSVLIQRNIKNIKYSSLRLEHKEILIKSRTQSKPLHENKMENDSDKINECPTIQLITPEVKCETYDEQEKQVKTGNDEKELNDNESHNSKHYIDVNLHEKSLSPIKIQIENENDNIDEEIFDKPSIDFKENINQSNFEYTITKKELNENDEGVNVEDIANPRNNQDDVNMLMRMYTIENDLNDTNKSKSFNRTKTVINNLKKKELLLNEQVLKEIAIVSGEISYKEGNHQNAADELYPFFLNLNAKHFNLLEQCLRNIKDWKRLYCILEYRYKLSLDKTILLEIIDCTTKLEQTELVENQIEHLLNSSKEESTDLYLDFLHKVITILINAANFIELTDDLIQEMKEYCTVYKEKIIFENFTCENLFIYVSAKQEIKKKNYDKAYNLMEKVENEQVFQEYPNFNKTFAKCCQRLKYYKKAIKHFKVTLKIVNSDFESCFNIGECYLKLDNIKGAEKYLKFCTNLPQLNNKDKLKLFFLFAKLYYKINKYEEAIEYFEKCIGIDPTSYRSHFNMALIYNEKKDFAKAKHHLEICLGINPNYEYAIFELFKVKLSIGDKKVSPKDVEKIIHNIPEYYLDFAKILIDNYSDHTGAFNIIKKSIKLQASSAYKTIESIAPLIIREDFKTLCYDIIIELLKENDDDYRSYLKASIVYSDLELYDQASKIMKIFIDKHSKHFPSHSEIGTMFNI